MSSNPAPDALQRKVESGEAEPIVAVEIDAHNAACQQVAGESANAETKRCGKCKATKPASEFSKKSAAKDGLRSECRACAAERNREWRRANAERVAEYQREWHAANRDRVTERYREWYAANRDRVTEYRREHSRAYYEANKARIAEQKSAWYAANRERQREYHRAYREANREAVAERNRAWREANRDRICKTGRRAVDPLSRKGFVYRMYDDAGDLLYVGLTYNITRRFFDDTGAHAKTKEWFDAIAFVWVEEFATYADAQEEERHAYVEEMPIFNKAPLYPTGDRPTPVGESEYNLETRDFVPREDVDDPDDTA